MTKVINFWGGPGLGKSTSAAELFVHMKKSGYNVELVTEAIKDFIWEERTTIYPDQLYILAKQNRRVQRLIDKVDYVISDSPITLGLIYMDSSYFQTFKPFVFELWNSYENINFLLTRSFAYQPLGRLQSDEEAIEVDKKVIKFLDENSIPHHNIVNSQNRLSEIKGILNV